MITLFLGGARSGKSTAAERLAAGLPAPVTYVATAQIDPGDGNLAQRIAIHRGCRPPSWSTVEAGADLPGAMAGVPGTALVDSLGSWVAAHRDFAIDLDGLLTTLSGRSADTIIVSDEVGLGVHPETELGRRYRDVLGAANQAVAEIADSVFLVVAGRCLPLERGPE